MNVTERLLSRALRDALELIPRISEDDPMAPALADWCRNTSELLRIVSVADEVAKPIPPALQAELADDRNSLRRIAAMSGGQSGGQAVFE